MFGGSSRSNRAEGTIYLFRKMCRYGQSTYKEPFACFECRKVFKQVSRWELPESQRLIVGEQREINCPQCSGLMADMGFDFKAPKMNDIKQWEKVRLLFQHGYNFYSCGCCGPGLRPDLLREVEGFLASNKSLSDGETLLKKIAQKK